MLRKGFALALSTGLVLSGLFSGDARGGEMTIPGRVRRMPINLPPDPPVIPTPPTPTPPTAPQPPVIPPTPPAPPVAPPVPPPVTIDPPVIGDPIPPTSNGKPPFIIGVWYQPIRLMPTWKARGINTLVGYDNEGGGISRDSWTKAARENGFMYITQPTADMATDGADPYLLAWSQPDEPDGAGNFTPQQIQDNYNQWKLVSSKPVFLNVDGWKMLWRPAQDYIDYCKGSDIIAFDYYVANRGDAPDGVHIIGDRVKTLKQLSGNKPILAFIESSDQDLRLQWWVVGTPLADLMRGPTPEEMQAQIDQAVQNGAAGIVYFPDMIGIGFEGYDGTKPDVEAQMIQANTALMTTYGPPQPQ